MAVPKLVRSVLEDNIFAGGNGIDAILANPWVAIVVSAAAMLLAAIAASYMPARRAADVEPMQALRTE